MLRTPVLTCLLLAALAWTGSGLQAQEQLNYGHYQYVPYGPSRHTPDWQWFAPMTYTDLDSPRNEGYFGSVEYLRWWMSKPDRTPVGNAVVEPFSAYYNQSVNYAFIGVTGVVGAVGATDSSAHIGITGVGQTLSFIPLSPNDVGHAAVNSIDSAYPQTISGNGNRFEFGYVEDDCGWMVSVMDGVDFSDAQFYGIDDKRREQLGSTQGLPGTDAVWFFAPDLFYNPITGGVDVAAPGQASNPPTVGDQAIFGIDGLLTVHVNFADPQGLLFGFIDGDGDGLADDLDGNLIIDANDRVRLAATFDRVIVHNHSSLSGVELTKIRRKRPTFHGAFLEMFLGVRYIDLDDRFDFFGQGGILTDTTINQRNENRMVGPQVGFRYEKPNGRLTFGLQGRALFAANFVSLRQSGVVADHLTPGVPGLPYALPPTSFARTEYSERFSPVGEFRAEAAMRLTKAITAKAGWNGMIMGNVSRAANSVVYELPAMGMAVNQEEVFIHGLNVGVEVNR
ncbi:MAG: BBP7 family outer membrane beta-barrel protein [Planctomycetales bacterium]|nr:BBP7 family outer membrane beta-barrel protein [Planctomycetales bacterium]